MMWHDPDFWEREWQEARNSSVYGRRLKNMDDVEWWNLRAPSYAARNGIEKLTGDLDSIKGEGNDSGNKKNGLLESILQSGFIDRDADLLDIGSGPGNYAIPLAGMFKRVVAVDPSSRMLSILEERAAALNINNIETVCMSWEDVNLNKLEWNRRFGLVLAIKTPGIKNALTLKKMMDASNKGCFYNGFIKRVDMGQQEVWRFLFNEEKPPVPAEVFYIFHLLHALGNMPALNLNKCMIKRKMTIDEAIQDLMLMMKPYRDVPNDLDVIVSEYIQKNAVDGVYTKVRDMIEGNISWTVSQDQDLEKQT